MGRNNSHPRWNITTSNNKTAGVNIYATDGLIKGKNLEITSTSTFLGDISAPNIYTKTHVNDLLAGKASSADISSAVSGKQNTLSFKDPAQLDPPVQGFHLLRGGNIVPGLAVSSPLTLTYYGNDYNEIGLMDPFAVPGDIKLNGTIKTNRVDDTLLFQATKYNL